ADGCRATNLAGTALRWCPRQVDVIDWHARRRSEPLHGFVLAGAEARAKAFMPCKHLIKATLQRIRVEPSLEMKREVNVRRSWARALQLVANAACLLGAPPRALLIRQRQRRSYYGHSFALSLTNLRLV